MRDKLVKAHSLIPHPEGGHYKRVYEGDLQDTPIGMRPCATAIMYLLSAGEFSTFHRIKSDEVWFLGESNSGIILIELTGDGLQKTLISREIPVYTVKAGHWFAAELEMNSENSYALAYCSVSPGFDFSDLEIASVETLIKEYPQYCQEITRLCRART